MIWSKLAKNTELPSRTSSQNAPKIAQSASVLSSVTRYQTDPSISASQLRCVPWQECGWVNRSISCVWRGKHLRIAEYARESLHTAALPLHEEYFDPQISSWSSDKTKFQLWVSCSCLVLLLFRSSKKFRHSLNKDNNLALINCFLVLSIMLTAIRLVRGDTETEES